MSKSGSVAFYARVSSEAQARAHTIDSQVAALKERIAADGLQLEPDHGYVDDGCSGTNLQRPALEKLRDAVAGGESSAFTCMRLTGWRDAMLTRCS